MSDRHKRRRDEEEELLAREEEESESSEEEESGSEEEESDSSVEAVAQPLLKPVFVRKRDRVTLIEAEEEEKRLEQLRIEEDRLKEERKRESVKIMDDILKREEEAQKVKDEVLTELAAINTDDDDEEVSYDLWKIREMKRLKRTREEREQLAKEKSEVDRIHNMTEEERAEYLRRNPKIVTNKAEKGKYKFLQKYFHRGAFFLDEEEQVLKRDFAEPTGEDAEVDRSTLPQVMQVKNFGKASRSKYTHLTAEDTTDHSGGVWATETPVSSRFVAMQAGSKSVFDRPAAKKRKPN